MPSQNPQARSTDLVVQPMDDEVLVFDRAADRAHSLNATAAAVWRACDGTRDPDAIAAHVGLEADVVALALGHLSDCALLTAHVETGISRRSVLRKASLTAAGLTVALPVIRSIAAPSAALAGSVACAHSSDCPGGTCHSNGFCSAGGCTSTGGIGGAFCTSHPCCVGRTCTQHVGYVTCA